MHAQNWYEYRIENDDWQISSFSKSEVNQMMTEVSNAYCFSDCCDCEIGEIHLGGRSIEYVGWHPDLEYTYIYTDTREVAWTGSFPAWDH